MKLPRFSLRTLLIGITAICMLLGAIWARYRLAESEHQRQQKLADQLKIFGEVKWERQMPWWVRWAGDFESITTIDCHHNADFNQALDAIEKVPTITTICLWDHQLDEEVIKRLISLSHLKTVVVNSHITSWFGFGYDQALKKVDERVDSLRTRLPKASIMNVIQPALH